MGQLLSARHGQAVGALGGLLAALSPSLIAHGSLATTDACFALFSLVALAAIQRYGEAPTARRLLVMGIGLGLAMAAKQSALFLFVIALGVLWRSSWRDTRQLPPARRIAGLIVRLAGQGPALLCIALFVSWALYGFASGPLFYPRSLPRLFGLLAPFQASVDGLRAPAPVLTMLTQLAHLRSGHPAFLLGATSEHGWWYSSRGALQEHPGGASPRRRRNGVRGSEPTLDVELLLALVHRAGGVLHLCVVQQGQRWPPIRARAVSVARPLCGK